MRIVLTLSEDEQRVREAAIAAGRSDAVTFPLADLAEEIWQAIPPDVTAKIAAAIPGACLDGVDIAYGSQYLFTVVGDMPDEASGA